MKFRIAFIIIILTATLAGLAFPREGASGAGESDGPEYKLLPENPPEGEGAARMVFFSSASCEECQEVKTKLLPRLIKKYPGRIACRIYDLDADPEGVFLLWMRYEEKYGEAEKDVPVIYMDGKILDGFEDVKKRLEQSIVAALEKGGATWPEPAPKKKDVSDTEQTARGLESLTIMAVIGAGLADGVNPCAFTTIIFLISYLTMIGRNRRQILITGILYSAAVFVTYFALGLGLLRIAQKIVDLNLAGRILYGVTAAISFVAAFLSFRDYRLAKKGRYKDMTLQLSDKMKQRIRHSIHSKIKGMGTAAAAIILGVLVAMFELPCTGQVYVPIIAALSNEELRARAVPYLLLYNLMFILPLILVFAFAWLGASSGFIGGQFKKRVAGIKLAMAAVFMAMGWTLIYMATH